MIILITFCFTTVFAQLISLQLIRSGELIVRAVDQWTRDVPLKGERGDIFDASGRLLAGCETVYTVYVRPNATEDKERTAKVLSGLFGVDENYLKNKFLSGVSEVTIKKNVSKELIEAVRECDIKGVYFSQTIKRKYVYGDFLSSVLGFTNVDCMGQAGIEAYYDKYLRGVDGSILTEADLVGREIEGAPTYYLPGQKGADVYLTVDYGIQSFLQKAVEDAYVTHKAKSASCIMLDCKTGAIVGLARSPSFDLNNLPRDDLSTLMYLSKNTLVCDVYEPGSTFKILTASIGLETGAYSEKSGVFCPGYRMVDGQRIRCWKTIGHGSQTFREGVQNSCNCLFMDVALKVGTKTMYEYLRNFGVNEKTGVDISGEGKGLMIAESAVKNVDLARVGFGQAVAVTPIELVTAFLAAINGGELLKPYIVSKIVDNSGKEVFTGQKTVRRSVISEKTSAMMRDILESVVKEGGGKNAQVNGYRIGGKTGTAQKYEGGRVASGKYVSTFVGFAPADDPRYILLFIVDEPSGGVYYGSMVAAPYAAKIFSDLFTYIGLESGDKTELQKVSMPDVVGLATEEADKALKEVGITYEYLDKGTGKISCQIPAPGSDVTTNITAYLEG